MKRGQITVFIILGIFVFAVFALIALFLAKKPEVRPHFEDSSIQTYVQECIRTVSTSGIIELARQGGYRNLISQEYAQYNSKDKKLIAPIYFNKASMVPSIQILESELSSYVNEELPGCTDFKLFESQGIDIENGKASTRTTIIPGKVIIETEYPITAKKDKEVLRLTHFSAIINLDYYGAWESSRRYVEEVAGSEQGIPLTSIADFDKIATFQIDRTTSINIITSKGTVTQPGFQYIFAVRTS